MGVIDRRRLNIDRCLVVNGGGGGIYDRRLGVDDRWGGWCAHRGLYNRDCLRLVINGCRGGIVNWCGIDHRRLRAIDWDRGADDSEVEANANGHPGIRMRRGRHDKSRASGCHD